MLTHTWRIFRKENMLEKRLIAYHNLGDNHCKRLEDQTVCFSHGISGKLLLWSRLMPAGRLKLTPAQFKKSDVPNTRWWFLVKLTTSSYSSSFSWHRRLHASQLLHASHFSFFFQAKFFLIWTFLYLWFHRRIMCRKLSKLVCVRVMKEAPFTSYAELCWYRPH